MGSLNKLEAKLDDIFDKKAPYKLPEKARKSIAHSMWWLAIVLGVLELWSAYSLWDLGHTVDRAVDYLNAVNSYYGISSSNHLGLFFYISLIAMAAVGVLLLLAVSDLKAMKKKGWDLVLYSVLVQVVVSLAELFSNVDGGFGKFIFWLLGAALSAYFLFQVRGQFTSKSHVKE